MGIVRKSLRGWRNFIRFLNRKVPYLGFLVHFIATVIIAFSMFALASLFLIGVTTVKGRSMEPTLSENDRLLTFRLGRFFSNLLGMEYVPKRGEIVIFSKDGDDEQLLIKRVIGLPNERIVIKNKVLTVYNEENPDGFKPDLNFDEQFEAFRNDETFHIYVERGEIFVLGDNLEVSADSRVLGNIAIEDIDGNLLIRTWPISKFTFF